MEIYQKLDAIQISIYTSFDFRSIGHWNFNLQIHIRCNNANIWKNYQIIMESEISSYYFKIIILCTKNICRSHHMYINYIISFKNITFLCECKKGFFAIWQDLFVEYSYSNSRYAFNELIIRISEKNEVISVQCQSIIMQ